MVKNNFSYHVTNYLSVHLPKHLGLSLNTIKSYRDAFTVLIEYLMKNTNIPLHKMCINQLGYETICDFLRWLETERCCSNLTRNQRLATIHSFFRYLQTEAPENLLLCQKVLLIPFKKCEQKTMSYLTLEGIKIVLEQPNPSIHSQRRDLVLLSLLYDTGARVQEIVDLKVSNVKFSEPATIVLNGKGNKSRIIPLMKSTTALLKQYMEEKRLLVLESNRMPLFSNRTGSKLTRAGVSYILAKYIASARTVNPQIIPDTVSPHSIRHSKAMHLLQAGVNLIYIRDLLGHVDLKTTEIYARADTQMKRAALEKLDGDVTPAALPIWQKDSDLLYWLKNFGK